MSSNIDAVQGIYAAFGEGRVGDIVAKMAEPTVFIQPGGAAIPWSGAYASAGAVAEFFGKLDAAVAVTEFVPEQYVETGDTVVAIGHWAGNARSTGKPFASTWAMTWKFRDGKVYFYEAYEDTAVIAQAFH